MDQAAVIEGQPDEQFIGRLKEQCVSQAVLIDVCQFDFLEKCGQIDKVCIVYTKRLKRAIDFEPLYRCKHNTLLIYAECEPNINSIGVGRFSDLKRFVINKNMLALSENACIESLCIYQVGKLDDFKFLSYFPNLKNLVVKNGEIGSMTGVNEGLISLTLKHVNILMLCVP